MTADRNRRVEELFASALEYAESERVGFLKARCGTDSSLLADVLDLLKNAEPDSNFDYSTQIDPCSPAISALEDEPRNSRGMANLQNAGAISPPLPIQSTVAIDTTPSTIDRFQVLQKLGSGGFASVYHGFDLQIKRNVAIKVLHPERGKLDELLTEARAQAQLEHEGIIRVYDVKEQASAVLPDGRKSSVPCIVMEYVDGGTLSIAIRSRQLTHLRSAEIVMTVAEAMAYAHRKGIIHRDLKPQNILLDRNGRPKVADFGIALHGEGFKATNVCGTLAYMSPEQMRGEPLDARADIWSLGVIFYELLTGRRPFIGSMEDIAIRIASEDPPRPRQRLQSIPPELESVCLECLQRDKDGRLQSMSDLLKALQLVMNNNGALKELPESHSVEESLTESRSATDKLANDAPVLAPWTELADAHRSAVERLLTHLAKANISRLSAATRNPTTSVRSCPLLDAVRAFSRKVVCVKIDVSADNQSSIRDGVTECLAALGRNGVYAQYADTLRPAIIHLTELLVSVARTKLVVDQIHFATREFASSAKDETLFRQLLDL